MPLAPPTPVAAVRPLRAAPAAGQEHAARWSGWRSTRALGQELMLTMPRVQPADAAALEHWLREARSAARLNHPNLAPRRRSRRAGALAVHRRRPRARASRCREWLAAHPHPAPTEAVGWLCDALQGLAFAHEAGVAHGDLQLHHLLINEQRQRARDGARRRRRRRARARGRRSGARQRPRHGDGPDRLRAQREAAERDVLACGLLLQHLLTGQPPLDEPDTALVDRAPGAARAARSCGCRGRTPQPVPEALRAIANRSTSSQERQRYLNARTLLRALDGWRDAEAQDTRRPARLAARPHAQRRPPAGDARLGARVARLTAHGRPAHRRDRRADPAGHGAQLRAAAHGQFGAGAGHADRRQRPGADRAARDRAARAERRAPGRQRAARLAGPAEPDRRRGACSARIDRVRLAGHTAQALRPAGYDAEVVFLVAVLQNLGRLLVQYHFADEAEQIWQLMRPSPPPPMPRPARPNSRA